MHLGKDLAATAIAITIMAAQGFIKGQTPGWLPSDKDTFHFDVNAGAALQVRSSAGHQLTWGVLDIVLRCLQQCLVIGKAYEETTFDIHENIWGVIGSGMVYARKPLVTSS